MDKPQSESIPTEPTKGQLQKKARDSVIDLLREKPSEKKQKGNNKKRSSLSRKEKRRRRRQRKGA
jgi:hypothetical protein